MSDEVRTAVLGCLLGAASGPVAPPWLVDLLGEGLAGVTLFSSNLDGSFVAEVTRARSDAVVAIDEEAGDVTRVCWRQGSPLPGNAALGAVDDPSLTALVAEHVARSLVALGVNLNLAPCVDVNTDPANPVIGTRSFGAEPGLAARHAHAFVTGMQRAGVAACAKHFPGHGSTDVDSHLALPLVDDPWEVLAARDLPPFTAAIEAGVAAVMIGHLRVPCLGEAPTSQNPVAIDRLRRLLGFDGIIVTDALDMAAVGSADDLGHAAVASLRAGCDLLCLGPALESGQVASATVAVSTAVQDGVLQIDALRRSQARVRAMVAQANRRRRQACAGGHPAVATRVDEFRVEELRVEEFRVEELGRDIAARAITADGTLRPVRSRSALVVECRPTPPASSADVVWGVSGLVAGLDPSAAAITVTEPVNPGALMADRHGRPTVLVVRGLAVDPWQRAFVEAAAGSDPLVLVELGWPAADPPPVDLYVVTHGASAASCRAVADLLFAPAPAGAPHG